MQLVTQFDGGPEEGGNCGCAVGAMLTDFGSGGVRQPTGSQVRALCLEPNGLQDVTGGTDPQQVATAVENGWFVVCDVDIRDFEWAWTEGERNDRALGIAISYGPVAAAGLSNQSGFTANHSIVLHGGKIYDPLRSSGALPQTWPKHVLREAAEKLLVGTPPNLKELRQDWPGKAYVTIAPTPTGGGSGGTSTTPKKYSVRFKGGGSFWVYVVGGGRIQSRSAKKFMSNTSAPCSEPQPIPWTNQPARRLVRVSEGAIGGKWVEPGSSNVTLVES